MAGEGGGDASCPATCVRRHMAMTVIWAFTYVVVDLDIVCRACGMRDEEVATARARGRREREMEAIIMIQSGE